MGLKTLAVGGVGADLMGDWVLKRLQHFGVDTSTMQQQEGLENLLFNCDNTPGWFASGAAHEGCHRRFLCR